MPSLTTGSLTLAILAYKLSYELDLSSNFFRRLYSQTLLDANRRPTSSLHLPTSASTQQLPADTSHPVTAQSSPNAPKRAKRKVLCVKPAGLSIPPKRTIVAPSEPVINPSCSSLSKPPVFDISKRFEKIKPNTIRSKKSGAYSYPSFQDMIFRLHDFLPVKNESKFSEEELSLIRGLESRELSHATPDQVRMIEGIVAKFETIEEHEMRMVNYRVHQSMIDLRTERSVLLTTEEEKFVEHYTQLVIDVQDGKVFRTAKMLELRLGTARIRECLTDIQRIPAFQKELSKDFSTKIYLENFVSKKLPPIGTWKDYEIADKIFQEWLPPSHPSKHWPSVCMGSCSRKDAYSIDQEEPPVTKNLELLVSNGVSLTFTGSPSLDLPSESII